MVHCGFGELSDPAAEEDGRASCKQECAFGVRTGRIQTSRGRILQNSNTDEPELLHVLRPKSYRAEELLDLPIDLLEYTFGSN